MQYAALMYSFSYLEPVCCSMPSSNCCFLACIQVSQEAGQVVLYSHLLKNFLQFIVIHTVKGLGIVNKAEIYVFLETLLFQLYIPLWQLEGETVADFIFLGSKITADGDCSLEIRRHLLLGRKVMTNLDSILNGSPDQVGCMRQVLRDDALEIPRVMGWGGKWEGGSGWGHM